jgi:protein-arginine kinase activator protein McsA
VDTLKTELKDAVEKEDYEKAALVRDKLKELESKAEY